MNYIDIICPIKKELAAVEKIIAGTLKSDIETVKNMNGYVFGSGGKRIRPALLLLSSALFEKNISGAVKTAAAVELIHSATLVHDDVIDNALTRRSKLSVNAKFGNTAAVLFGDYLYCKSFEIISGAGDDFIAGNLLKAARSMCEGEIYQNVNNYNPYIDVKDYYKIIENKTAVFLSKCCAIGAYCAKAGLKNIKNMEKFGLNTGMAFQIADDILDISSDETAIGKPAAKDILEGKITLPILILFSKLSSGKRSNIFKRIFSAKKNKLTPDFVLELINMCREYETPSDSMKIAARYIERAEAYLKKAGGRPEIAEKLTAFCRFMISRTA